MGAFKRNLWKTKGAAVVGPESPRVIPESSGVNKIQQSKLAVWIFKNLILLKVKPLSYSVTVMYTIKNLAKLC